MISKLTVFHRGGAVLWTSDDDNSSTTSSDATSSADSVAVDEMQSSAVAMQFAINQLIQSVLLSDKSASDSMVHDAFTLKWSFENKFNLVFVAVFYSFQKLLYIDELLDMVKREFIKMFDSALEGGVTNLTRRDYASFIDKYKRIQKYFRNKRSTERRPKRWSETKSGRQQQKYVVDDKKGDKKDSKKKDDDDDADASNGRRVQFGRKGGRKPRAFDPSKFKKGSKSAKDVTKNGKSKNGKSKKGKLKKGSWSQYDVTNFKKKKVSEAELDKWNMAEDDDGDDDTEGGGKGEEEEETFYTPDGDANFADSSDESSDDFSDLLGDDHDADGTANGSGTGSGMVSGIWKRFGKLIGNKALEEEDLVSVLKTLEDNLSSKNVANVIAKELCDSVKQSLIGREVGTFSTIRAVVKDAMTECMERILTPDHPINILHGIETAKDEGRPYSIVFIGVNGVGKSTSLSKVINYLKSRNLTVSVAACDTFRSGAVEQLKTHCKALNVRLFSQGYARDAGAVAFQAIESAKRYRDDVVLIDTAGRMQNNAPLMRSLVSLIQRNKPDLTLFVGEALVGNDGVDQLMEFNKALQINNNRHLIDGIILTKFDTVDDKVGAAISMTYKSKKPIVFIGTGQNYGDLKRMHVRTLIRKLMR